MALVDGQRQNPLLTFQDVFDVLRIDGYHGRWHTKASAIPLVKNLFSELVVAWTIFCGVLPSQRVETFENFEEEAMNGFPVLDNVRSQAHQGVASRMRKIITTFSKQWTVRILECQQS